MYNNQQPYNNGQPYNNQPPYGNQPPYQQPYYQQPYYQQPPVVVRPRTNGMGTAGFVLALLSWIFCWVPVANLIMWLFGLVFSIIGMFKAPRGLAIAGFVLSVLSIVATVVCLIFIGGLTLLSV